MYGAIHICQQNDDIFEIQLEAYEWQIPGGTHTLWHTRICHPKGLLFHQKSFDMGHILVKKILRTGSHFTKKIEKL